MGYSQYCAVIILFRDFYSHGKFTSLFWKFGSCTGSELKYLLYLLQSLFSLELYFIPMNPSVCSLPNAHSILQQLWAVMSNSDSILQVDRQIILLETFLSKTGEAVNIADLDLLSRVMFFLTEQEATTEVYSKYLDRITDILNQPPTMTKASDELNYKQHLVQYCSTMGCILLQTRNEDLKRKILEILYKLTNETRSKSSNWTPIKACIHAIERSELMDCMADFIAMSGGNLYYNTLYTTLHICLQSKFACWKLLMKSTIDTLLLRMTTNMSDNSRKVLDTSFQLLWTLCCCTSSSEDWVTAPPPSRAALRGLRFVLKESIMKETHPDNDTNISNIAAFVLKLMHLFPSAEYGSSGLIGEIAYFVTKAESHIESTHQPNFKNPQKYFEFIKLMLACLSLSPISPSSLETFEQYKIAQYLMKLLSLVSPPDSKVFWSLEERLELVPIALKVVCAHSDILQKQLIDAGIVTKLLSLLEVYSDDPLEEITVLVTEALLTLYRRKVTTESTLQSLQEERIIDVLLKLCKLYLKSESYLKIRSQIILRNSLTVLAYLMENKTNFLKQHVETSLYIVSTLYKRILKPCDSDSLIDNRLIVVVGNYAWKCLICNEETISKFISSCGIRPHIDILECSVFSVQIMFLTALCDICEYSQSVESLMAWRGSRGVTFISLLCRIWRTEEEFLEVSRTNDGCIRDSERPLMGKEQSILSIKEKRKIVSIYDVFGSARPKIYAIVQLLLRHKEVTALCDKRFGFGYEKLPSEDKVTLKVVEAYLPLKLGEIWWEIKNKQENVMPLDRYVAETLANR